MPGGKATAYRPTQVAALADRRVAQGFFGSGSELGLTRQPYGNKAVGIRRNAGDILGRVAAGV